MSNTLSPKSPIRNLAIIAHVDHGKTTLVDALLQASGIFAEHEKIVERVMDQNEQEKERGITIYSKNAAIEYQKCKINIIDTPGHADFGSEVERVLNMIDATLLVVDAYEGPMPQTKFVLKKSLELGKKVLVVINKIDKPTARVDWVIDQLFDLFVKLGATDEQLDFPYIYTIAKDGIAIKELNESPKNILPLLDWILEHVPLASRNEESEFKMQVATLAYDSFLGRIAIGRVQQGRLKTNQNIFVLQPPIKPAARQTTERKNNEKRNGKVSQLFTFRGLQRISTTEIIAGDIVGVAGIADIFVGETITVNEQATPLPAIEVDPPSLSMYFMVNDSPFAGQEGKFVNSRQIRERLEKELKTNVGLQIDFESGGDKFKVLGRGEMHLAVLIESMRREGFELQVSQPEVVLQKTATGIKEPMENLTVNVTENLSGKVIELIAQRKGEMTELKTENEITTLNFLIPTRGLLGLRSQFIILTKGEGTLFSSFSHFGKYLGEIHKRQVGSLISAETGSATAYSLWNLQERGPIFISAGTEIYEGMIIGEHNQGTDLTVNPIKGKKLTNVRASGTDESIVLIPPIKFTLERALEYIKEDEYVEVTPQHIRLRKKWLKEIDRRRNRS